MIITRAVRYLLENDEVEALAQEIAVSAGFETARAMTFAKFIARERPRTLARLRVLLGGES